MENDAAVGFEIITTDDIDEIGTSGIVKLIRDRVGNGPVYLRYVSHSSFISSKFMALEPLELCFDRGN